MHLCERCGREHEAVRDRCERCGGPLVDARSVEDWETYLDLRTRARRDAAADDRNDDPERSRTALALAVGSYVAAVLVAGYGLAGTTAGFWLGGPLVVLASVLVTPPARRAVGNAGAALAFVALFVVGRSSPSAWLF